MYSLYGTGLLALSLSISTCTNGLDPRQNTGSDSSSAISTITMAASASPTDRALSASDTSTTTCTYDQSGNPSCGSGNDVGSNPQDDYLKQMCQPVNNSTGDPDLTFPCNAIYSLLVDCLYNGTNGTNGTFGPSLTSPAMQQQCFCPGGRQTDLWQNLEGCAECERLHGANRQYFIPVQYLSAESSSYCAASTMTRAIDEFLGNWTASSTISLGTSTEGTDVIGNKTDISYYFTPTSNSNTASTITSGSTETSSTTGSKSVSTGSSTASKTGSAAAASPTNSAAAGFEIPELFGILIIMALGYFL